MNIWTVDQPTIREQIKQRNALRRSALLPLLDEQEEFDRACDGVRQARFRAFRKSKQADYDRFYADEIAQRGYPINYISQWGMRAIAEKRFLAFLNIMYCDELVAMMEIAPDYLAITREVVES